MGSGGVEPEIFSPTMGEGNGNASAAGHVRICLGYAGALSGTVGCATVGDVVSMRLTPRSLLLTMALSYRAVGRCSSWQRRTVLSAPSSHCTFRLKFDLACKHIDFLEPTMLSLLHSPMHVSPRSLLRSLDMRTFL